MNMRAAFTALMLLLSPTIATAGENPVLGTWKLKSFVREVTATGEKINQMGEHPRWLSRLLRRRPHVRGHHGGQSYQATRRQPDR